MIKCRILYAPKGKIAVFDPTNMVNTTLSRLISLETAKM